MPDYVLQKEQFLSRKKKGIHLFNGTLELVHVALEERKVREEEVLEAAVLLRVGRQREDDADGYFLLACHPQALPATLVRHVEALLHRPGGAGGGHGMIWKFPTPNFQAISQCFHSFIHSFIQRVSPAREDAVLQAGGLTAPPPPLVAGRAATGQG